MIAATTPYYRWEMIKRQVEEIALALFTRQLPADKPRKIIVYGGALHNDRLPSAITYPYSFGPDLAGMGNYVEIDLSTAALLQQNSSLRHERWSQAYWRSAPKHKVVVFNPAPGSYIVILPNYPL